MKQIVYTQEQIDKISAMLNVVTVLGNQNARQITIIAPAIRIRQGSGR